MADNHTDIANALLSKFNQVLTAGGAARGAFVSFIDGGYPVSKEDLAFLAPPDTAGGDDTGGGGADGGDDGGSSNNASSNDAGSGGDDGSGGGGGQSGVNPLVQFQDQAYAFAAQVDMIPVGVGTWQPSGSYIANMYRWAFLQQIAVPDTKLTEDQAGQLKAANTATAQLYPAYAKYRNAWQSAQSKYQLLLLEPHNTPAAKVALRRAENALNDAMQDWEQMGSKAEFEQQFAVKNQLSGVGFDQIVQQLKDRFDSYMSGNGFTNTQNSSYAPVLCIPPDFYTDAVTWNTFSFSSKEVEKYQHDDKTTFGGGVALMEDFFVFGGSASGGTEKHLGIDTTGGLKIEFEYIRVTLDRSAWFDTGLLHSQAWWFQGAWQREPTYGGLIFSDGAPPPNTQGIWQMIPQDVIFTRNLRITMDMSNTTNSSTVTTLKQQMNVKFLIFPIAQEGSTYNSSTKDYKFDSSSSGIFAPQMQMFCFLCDLMPKEPNPAPDLLPDKQPDVQPKLYKPPAQRQPPPKRAH